MKYLNCNRIYFLYFISNPYNKTRTLFYSSKIPEKLCLQSGGVLHFTVMDHDLLSWSNDFEGEGFLELAVLPGVKGDIGEGAYKNLKYTELNLIQPKGKFICLKAAF